MTEAFHGFRLVVNRFIEMMSHQVVSLECSSGCPRIIPIAFSKAEPHYAGA